MDSIKTEVDSKHGKDDEWKIVLPTNGLDVCYKLDTGSQVNVIPVDPFKRLQVKPKLHSTNVKLTSYSGNEIPTVGACILKVAHKDKTVNLHCIVTKQKSTPILGIKACDTLGLVKRVYTLCDTNKSNKINSETIHKDYADLFEGLGCLPGEHTIQIDNTIPPVVHPCRKVPFAQHNALRKELDRMEDKGVICKEDNISSFQLERKFCPDCQRPDISVNLMHQQDSGK
ncbi:MAG: hypothetical protein ABW185_10560 [Sedimenticola sp.]